MDKFIIYLYGSLDSDIYMKILEVFKILKACNLKFQEIYYIKLQTSLYKLKHYEHMLYNHLSEYLLK